MTMRSRTAAMLIEIVKATNLELVSDSVPSAVSGVGGKQENVSECNEKGNLDEVNRINYFA